MYLRALLNINNKTIGIKALFNCWGKKNQLNKTSVNKSAHNPKYFEAHLFLLVTKKAAITLMGQAHNKL